VDSLPEGVRKQIVQVAEYPLDHVVWKAVKDARVDPGRADEAELEFKKFLVLTVLGYSPLGMLGKLPDEIWHQFILFTEEYSKFCDSVFGGPLHHYPDTPMTPVPLESGRVFVMAYRKHFGPLPRIWFEEMPEPVREFYDREELVGAPPSWASAWIAEPSKRELFK
jgi:hypothetical protein